MTSAFFCARATFCYTHTHTSEVVAMIKRLLLTVLLSIASVNVAAQSEGPEPVPPTPNPTVPPNISLTYNAGVSRLVAPGNIMLVANAEAFDSTIASISIHKGSVLLGSVKAGTNTFLWKDVPAGTHDLTAVATDSRGIWSRSAPLSVTVTGNASPTVTLTATLTGASAPGTVVLSAAAGDSDGTVSKVEFFNGSTLLATVTQAPFAYTWSNVPVGSYNLFARATDNLGAATTSQPSLVSVNAAGAQVYYLYADQINTAREITNAAGVVVWRADTTEPFGVNMPNENPSNLGTFTYNLRFPGQSFDKESALHYNYFRDYDPALGRYIQSDPIGLRGGINTYGYVEGNPLKFADPLGLQVWQQGSLPARVQSHNEWANIDKQMQKEFVDTDTGIPLLPNEGDVFDCKLVCPSDTPNSCPAPSNLSAIPMRSPSGEMCERVCVTGQFATSAPTKEQKEMARSHARSAGRGDWQKMFSMMRR